MLKRDLIYTVSLLLVILFAARAALAGEGAVKEWKPPPPEEERTVGRQVNGYMIAGYVLGGLAVVSLAGGIAGLVSAAQDDEYCKNRPRVDSDAFGSNWCMGGGLKRLIAFPVMTVGALSLGGVAILLTVGYEDYDKSGKKIGAPATGRSDLIPGLENIDSMVVGMKGTF